MSWLNEKKHCIDTWEVFNFMSSKTSRKEGGDEDKNVRDFPAVSHCYSAAIPYFPVIGEELYATLFQEVHLCRATLHLLLHLESPVLLNTETQQAAVSSTLTAMWCVRPYNKLLCCYVKIHCSLLIVTQLVTICGSLASVTWNSWIKSLHTPKVAAAITTISLGSLKHWENSW